DEDYEKALRELNNLHAADRISLFINGILFLLKNQWNKALKNIHELSSLINPNTSDEEYVLSCFLYSLENTIHTGKGLRENFLELQEEKLQSLTQNGINSDDLNSIMYILRGISEFKKNTEKDFTKNIELLNSSDIGLIELQTTEIKLVEIFKKYYNEERQTLLIVGLLSSDIVKKLIYSLFINTISEIYKPASIDEKKSLLERVNSLIKRIEPRIDNSEHSIPIFFKMLKKAYNDWLFSWFISQSLIQEGFNWLESRDDNDDFFIIPLKYHPYDCRLEDIVVLSDVFEGNLLKGRLEIKQKLLEYFSLFSFYSEFLRRHSDLNQYNKDEIFKTIEKNTERIWEWKDAIYLEIKQIYLPFELGKMYEERRNYDDAIIIFQNSTGALEDREKAIEECKYNRDGFIYNKLKALLRGTDQQEQKQLLGYGMLFKIEVRLRNIVDEEMTKVNGSKWLEDEHAPKLKDVITECKKRHEKYKDEVFYKSETPHRLIEFTTLLELKEIIEEKWKCFEPQFKVRDSFLSSLVPVCKIRLDIAHARFLDDKQLKTLSDQFDQLNKVLELKKPIEHPNLLSTSS
ncbi:MAG: hypothetical protein WAV76_14955, partial [Bacteroidota bacterium]